jgi:hypothetical protein
MDIPSSQPLDALGCVVDDRGDGVHRLGFHALALELVDQDHPEVLHRPLDRAAVAALAGVGQRRQPGEQRLDLGLATGGAYALSPA